MKGLKREPRGEPRTHCYNIRLVLVTFSVSSSYQFKVFFKVFFLIRIFWGIWTRFNNPSRCFCSFSFFLVMAEWSDIILNGNCFGAK